MFNIINNAEVFYFEFLSILKWVNFVEYKGCNTVDICRLKFNRHESKKKLTRNKNYEFVICKNSVYM